jgi:hypothetical protein
MLKINPDPKFTANVNVTVPGQEATSSISITFRYKSKKQLAEWKEAFSESDDKEFLGEVVLGWSGVDVDFSPETFALFLDNYPAAALEIVTAYHKLLLDSRAKN